MSAHLSLNSVIQIETMSFDNIAGLKECQTDSIGQYMMQSVPLYQKLDTMAIANGGAVVTRDQTLLTISIIPSGKSENGHWFTLCFE